MSKLANKLRSKYGFFSSCYFINEARYIFVTLLKIIINFKIKTYSLTQIFKNGGRSQVTNYKPIVIPFYFTEVFTKTIYFDIQIFMSSS